MNDTDTSDEAYLQWIRGKEEVYPRDAWAEAVRRCEARMEANRCQFDLDLITLQGEIIKLKRQMEERESSAFCHAAGWVKGIMVSGNVPTTDQILAACQAFKEQ